MKSDFIIKSVLGDKERFIIKKRSTLTDDHVIAKILNIDAFKYRNIMQLKFNGYQLSRITLFESKRDAQEALNWIMSAVTLNKLSQ